MSWRGNAGNEKLLSPEKTGDILGMQDSLRKRKQPYKVQGIGLERRREHGAKYRRLYCAGHSGGSADSGICLYYSRSSGSGKAGASYKPCGHSGVRTAFERGSYDGRHAKRRKGSADPAGER